MTKKPEFVSLKLEAYRDYSPVPEYDAWRPVIRLSKIRQEISKCLREAIEQGCWQFIIEVAEAQTHQRGD